MMIIRQTSLRKKERLEYVFLLCLVLLGRSRTRLAATPILLQAMTRNVVEGYEALQWSWTLQCNVFEWCRVELPLNSASIRRPSLSFFLPKCIRGPATKSPPLIIFYFLLPQKRWQPSRTAEPEVQAVPPRRHPPSAKKSLLHPLLRRFHAAPCCLLPDGSTMCPTISGFIKSCTHFWI